MRRGILIILMLGVVGVLAAGWWWARTSPQQVTDVLIDGGLEASRAEAFVATVGGEPAVPEEEHLVASGSIEGQEVAIVSEFGGRIVRLDIREGDTVETNQVLVDLDTASLEAQRAEAMAAVAAAQANLATVKAGVHPGEILAAEAGLLQAKSERDAALTAWQDAQMLLENPQEIQARIVQAKAEVDLADAQIEQAKARIASAEAERYKYHGQGSMEEKWLYRIHDYQVEAAKVGLGAANAIKAGAQETLEALRVLWANPLSLGSQVHIAEAQLGISEAGVRVAEAKLAELSAGPTEEEVALAEAQVAQAQAAVSALDAQLEKMTLRTPISGIVTSRSAHAGEAAIAGATLLTVANLDEVTLTIYVPEHNLGLVYLGQDVAVQVDSYPEQVFSGTVSHISQQAEFTPKNVQTQEERVNMVFAVKVRVPNPDHRLKPGMPADAILSID